MYGNTYIGPAIFRIFDSFRPHQCHKRSEQLAGIARGDQVPRFLLPVRLCWLLGFIPWHLTYQIEVHMGKICESGLHDGGNIHHIGALARERSHNKSIRLLQWLDRGGQVRQRLLCRELGLETAYCFVPSMASLFLNLLFNFICSICLNDYIDF